MLGPGVIEDTLAGVPLHMGVHEFYQVNTPAAELLYAKATGVCRAEAGRLFAGPLLRHGHDWAFDAAGLPRLVGVEVVPQAVEGAKPAARLGLAPEEADFRCMDAGAAAATQLAAEGARPDVIVVDPPRKGCETPP